jgi:type VI secretion system protein VasG
MADISRTASFGKLNPLAYKAIEGATVFCKMRGNPYVELQHWLMQILNAPTATCTASFATTRLDSGAGARPDAIAGPPAARGVVDQRHLQLHRHAVERGWVYGSLMFGEQQVRTGHLLVGMLKTASLRGALSGISKQFDKHRRGRPVQRFASCWRVARRGPGGQRIGAAPGEASDAIAPAAMGKQEALKRFTTDLTEQARGGKMDPIVGRDDEIRQVVDILMRRRQNNPILVGEAGVGKTAVVEGFAQRIARGDVPPSLKDVELRVLDVGLLQAGASMKGEFEQRLRSVIDEVQASEKADHPVHRRDAHPGRRGRRCRHRRCGQPAQAGTGARPAAHHRRHDLCRVQEAHREGPGADPPLPEPSGRRAQTNPRPS